MALQEDLLSWGRIGFLAVVFFAFSTLMEVVLEGASRNLQTLDAFAQGGIITLSQFVGCVLVAMASGGSIRAGSEQSGSKLIEHWLPYVKLAVLVSLATGCANIAVGFVQYPVKVVFKSSKLIPAMFVSVMMGNSKPYTWRKYFAAALICLGTAGFCWDHAGKDGSSGHMVATGVALLITSLLSDAYSSNTQQRMVQRDQIQAMDMMARVNIVGAVGVAAILLLSGEVPAIAAALAADERATGYVAAVGVSIGMSVWAYTHLIGEAGAVFTTGVGTLRKVVTVVLSYVIYPKPFSRIHLFAGVLVFLGLFLDGLATGASKSGKKASITKSAMALEDYKSCGGDEEAPKESHKLGAAFFNKAAPRMVGGV